MPDLPIVAPNHVPVTICPKCRSVCLYNSRYAGCLTCGVYTSLVVITEQASHSWDGRIGWVEFSQGTVRVAVLEKTPDGRDYLCGRNKVLAHTLYFARTYDLAQLSAQDDPNKILWELTGQYLEPGDAVDCYPEVAFGSKDSYTFVGYSTPHRIWPTAYVRGSKGGVVEMAGSLFNFSVVRRGEDFTRRYLQFMVELQTEGDWFPATLTLHNTYSKALEEMILERTRFGVGRAKNAPSFRIAGVTPAGTRIAPLPSRDTICAW